MSEVEISDLMATTIDDPTNPQSLLKRRLSDASANSPVSTKRAGTASLDQTTAADLARLRTIVDSLGQEMVSTQQTQPSQSQPTTVNPQDVSLRKDYAVRAVCEQYQELELSEEQLILLIDMFTTQPEIAGTYLAIPSLALKRGWIKKRLIDFS